jgi:hypothetical protein
MLNMMKIHNVESRTGMFGISAIRSFVLILDSTLESG